MSGAARKKNGSSVTIVDVAKQAGVSIKTVSRVINQEKSVRENTRTRVQQAIDSLGYQRNLFARSLRADKSFAFGFLFENPQGDYSADVLHGALKHCRKNGYHLVVEVLSEENIEEQVESFLAQTRVDGVFLTPPVCDRAKVLAALKAHDVPYVRISPFDPVENEPYITIDDFRAAEEIVSYLISIGHKKIAHIMGTPGHAATEARLAGYRKALLKNGLSPDDALVSAGNFKFVSGVEAGRKFLRMAKRPTAIFAANDETAAGVLTCAHEMGVTVPGELSVCGFDGGTVSRVVWPTLTTVNQSVRDLGEGAIAHLIALGSIDQEIPEPLILPYSVTLGDSTAPPGIAS